MTPAPNSFYTTGGTLSQNAPSYVERQADIDLLDGLRAGEFCYVLTSRQMGKSSLMVRAGRKLRESGVQTIALDLTAVGQNVTPEQWYDGLLAQMARQAHLEEPLDEFWLSKERLGPCQRFFAAIRDVVLPREKRQVVIFVDEIDTVRSLPFSTDEFFAAIRECYNRRVQDEEFRRLTFCLLGVATPSDLIRDTRTTPFNIGRRIELHDFTEEEAAPLTQGLPPFGSTTETPLLVEGKGERPTAGARQPKRLLSRILYWTGGHPYLTQRFCRAVAEQGNVRAPGGVDRICDELFLSNRAKERDDNLLFVRERLLRSEVDVPSLLELYLKVRRGEDVEDDETSPRVNVLRLSGIVKTTQGRLETRNHVYSRVFDDSWVDSNMPDADRRRLRAAFLRGVIRTGTIAAMIVAVLTAVVVIAAREAGKARRALAEARFSQAQAKRASGMAGQRYEGLQALKGARLYHDRAAVRDEAVGCLALLDLSNGIQPSLSGSLPAFDLIELHPNMQLAAGSASDGTTRLHQLKDNQILATIPGFGWPVAGLHFSSTEGVLAIHYRGHGSNHLAVWDWRRLNRLFEVGANGDALDFSSDGQQLAVGSTDGRITVFRVPSGETVTTLQPKLDSGDARVSRVIRFHPAGGWLATASPGDQYVEIWDSLSARRLSRLYHPSRVLDLAWHPRGHVLATGCGDSRIYLWNTNGFQREDSSDYSSKLEGHEDPVIGVAFNQTGNILASLAGDETLRLWIPSTGRQVTRTLDGSFTNHIKFSLDDRRLIAGGRPAQSRVWDVLSDVLMVLTIPTGRGDDVKAIDFSPDNRRLLAASAKQVTLWDANSGRELGIIPVTNSPGAWFSADNRHLIASSENVLFQWPLIERGDADRSSITTGTGRVLHPSSDHLGAIAPSLDRSKAAIIDFDKVVLVTVGSSSKIAREYDLDSHYTQMALHPRGEWLATRRRDLPLNLWKFSDSMVHDPIRLKGSKFFTFSPDGNWLATCHEGAFQFYRVGFWKEPEFTIPRHPDSEQHAPIAFALDGRVLAVASSRYAIQLYRPPQSSSSEPTLIATLENPDRFPLELLTFSPDGRLLAAATDRQIVQVWNLALLRQELAELGLDQHWPDYTRPRREL
jgi:WD40 repeat protein